MAPSYTCTNFERHGRAHEARSLSCASDVEPDARRSLRPLARPFRAAWAVFGAAAAAALLLGCSGAPPVTNGTPIEAKPGGDHPPDAHDPDTTRADEENHDRQHDDNTNVMKP